MAKYNTPEDKNINYFETRYCYEERQKLYIANEEINQVWDETDIPEFIKKWNDGESFREIKEYFGMDEWEFALIAIDLISKKKIDGRLAFFRSNKGRKQND